MKRHFYLAPAGLVLLGMVFWAGCSQRSSNGAANGPTNGTTAQNGTNGTTAHDVTNRLNDATVAFQEIMSMPERSIPRDLLQRAVCIAMVPGVKSGAFVVGAQYGKGFITCRKADGTGWSAPGNVRIEGGSVGFQIGGEESDAILLVMNDQGKERLLRSQFTLGGDASVAAGPVGREAQAKTDAMLTAQILSYTRTRGAFAGVSLEGATLRQDLDDNRALYGQELTNQQIITGNVDTPEAASAFIAAITRYSQ